MGYWPNSPSLLGFLFDDPATVLGAPHHGFMVSWARVLIGP
jgi:hypothetical protein